MFEVHACTRLAVVAPLSFTPSAACLSWHHRHSFLDTGTVSQSGTSSLSSSSCLLPGGHPRAFYEDAHLIVTALLPALPGLSVARSVCEVFSWASVLLGCDSALTFRPLLLPRLHTHLRLHLRPVSFLTFSAGSNPLTFASASPSARDVHLPCSLRLLFLLQVSAETVPFW